ncbi:MAG: hypothetical protein RLZZ502_152, partial [Pseudomonadota bacterium]
MPRDWDYSNKVFMFNVFFAGVALYTALTSSVVAQPDPNKVLRVAFPVAETG